MPSLTGDPRKWRSMPGTYLSKLNLQAHRGRKQCPSDPQSDGFQAPNQAPTRTNNTPAEVERVRVSQRVSRPGKEPVTPTDTARCFHHRLRLSVPA